MGSALEQPGPAATNIAGVSPDDPLGDGNTSQSSSLIAMERRTRPRAHSRPYRKLSGWVSAKLGAAGVYLILLITVSLCASIFIFSATQFQARVASLTSRGAPVTIWKIEQIRAQWFPGDRSPRSDVTTARVLEAEAASKLLVEEKRAVDAGSEVATKRETLLHAVQRLNSAAEKKLRVVADDELVAAIQNARPSLDLSKINSELTDFRSALAENWAQASKASAQTEAPAGKRAGPTPSMPGLDDLVTDDQRGLILNEVYELEAMRQSVIALPIYWAVMFPTDLLILVLVVVMGLLGSSLLLSSIYVSQFAERPFAFYIMRPFFGVITAFVVYIVAKAGIPLIADPNRLGGAAPVNPYFISFLAILSGLMSERAITWLESVGAGYFTDDNDARRDITSEQDPAIDGDVAAPSEDDERNKGAIERYVSSDAESLQRVKKWLAARNIDELVGFFVTDANRASERARMIKDLSIPAG